MKKMTQEEKRERQQMRKYHCSCGVYRGYFVGYNAIYTLYHVIKNGSRIIISAPSLEAAHAAIDAMV